ncbi:MAG: 16S rRNA (cytidine(1402)-2'-O)-methyltransferase [Bacteroidales bacterium]
MPKLYLIPTPIGNLEDITLRACRILGEVDLILAEDTRKTKILLNHLGISKPIRSYHKFNEHKTLKSIVNQIGEGTSVGLVTDAGTPGISDPGFLLIRECIKNEIMVECLPGATAFIPALVNSGLPSERFVFEGFLPAKKGRNKRLTALHDESRTMVFYESPYRLLKTLDEFKHHFGDDRQTSVSRELTKIHEETVRGTIAELIYYYSDHTVKGEFVIVLAGKPT